LGVKKKSGGDCSIRQVPVAVFFTIIALVVLGDGIYDQRHRYIGLICHVDDM